MTVSELVDLVIQRVRGARSQLTPRELIAEVIGRLTGVDEFDVRRALLDLLNSGQLVLNWDHTLDVPQPAVA